MVEARELVHKYPKRTALDGVSLHAAKGEIVGVLGPNGCGKSTLFRILATIQKPASGTALIDGRDAVRDPQGVRERIGVVFQSQSLDRKLSVQENLRAQGHLYGLHGADLARRIDSAISLLGLSSHRGDWVETLSGGMRRRTEIAKALLHSPSVLLMDEASTGLDPRARRELGRSIEELRRKSGVTILLTTHVLDEAEHCDRLVLLHQGRVVAEGSPESLRARVGNDVVEVSTADPSELSSGIAARFGIVSETRDSSLRLETANGHHFATELVEAFPGKIEAIAVRKPTLEDVFHKETGALIS